MTEKIALITGANKGIGYEIAYQLGKQGVTVLVGARNLQKAEEATNRLQAEQVRAIPVALDILVNNAGVFVDHEGTGLDVMRRGFETNFYGAYALTNALLPLIERSQSGRIVNQSSILGSMGTILTDEMYGQASSPNYTASKAALNAWTAHLSIRLRDTTIKVNACHPGWVKTDMGGSGANMEISEGAETAVYLATLATDGPSGGFFHKQERLPW